MALDELEGAQKYWDFYQQTGDDGFRQMAKQELGHSAILTQMLEEQGMTQEAAGLKNRRIAMERMIR